MRNKMMTTTKTGISMALRASACFALSLLTLCGSPSLAADGYPASASELLAWNPPSSLQLLELPAYRVEQRLQSRISECMRAAGFRYQPFVPDEHFPSLGFREEGQVGIVDSVLETLAGNLNVPATSENPNHAHFASLDGAAQNRYAERLWDRETGCATHAYRATYEAVSEKLGADRIDEYEEALNSVHQQVESDPAFDRALSAWRACAELRTGLPLSSPAHLDQVVREELDEASGGELPLSDLLHSPVTAGPILLDAAAVQSARELEATLRRATAACDQGLEQVVEGLQQELSRQTLLRFPDVLEVLFGIE